MHNEYTALSLLQLQPAGTNNLLSRVPLGQRLLPLHLDSIPDLLDILHFSLPSPKSYPDTEHLPFETM